MDLTEIVEVHFFSAVVVLNFINAESAFRTDTEKHGKDGADKTGEKSEN